MSPTRGHSGMVRQLAAMSKTLHQRGWVANHDGNISMRAADGVRFYATPTATSKANVSESDIIIVDKSGKRLSGRKRLFSEWSLHRAAFSARADARVVLHAHPPYATALGVAGRALGTPVLPEAVVSLGDNIPLIPYAMPKTPAQEAELARALTVGDADGVLIARNGILTVGDDLEQAYLRAELIEHLAKIVHAAAAFGPIAALPAGDVQKLLAARQKAGLGRAGRAGRA